MKNHFNIALLRESARYDAEHWLVSLMESSNDAIISETSDRIITGWNAGAEQLFGYRADEVLGKPVTTLTPRELGEEEAEMLTHLRGGESVVHLETTRLRKDQTKVAVSLTASLVRDVSGGIQGILEIARNVTGIKDARDSLTRYELIEHAPDGILQVDSSGVIVIANHTAETMFGYTREELLGKSVDALVPVGNRAGHAGHRKVFAAAGVTRPMGQGLELKALRKDGSEFPAEISLSPVHTEHGTNVTAVIRDVTERRRSEQQLRSLQKSYMTELETRQREAERLNQLKSEFVASVSHELRTPLHTIIGFAELLGEETEGPLNEKQRRFLQHIQTDSEHLLGLINDVLDLSRIEAGGLRLQTEMLPLAAVIDEAVGAIRPFAAAKPVTIREERVPDVSVLADPLRLRQILYNLLNNGVKFTPPGGEVAVRAVVDGDLVRFTVADTGIGIPQQEIERIFDKFYQVGNTTSGVRQGTGLGLTICRQLVEIQGGSIWVESEPNHGSQFHFTVPLRGSVLAG